MKLWQVSARVRHERNGWQCSIGVPTFFLDSDVQAIQSGAHACRIASKVINPFGEYSVYIGVVEIDGETGLSKEDTYCGVSWNPGSTDERKIENEVRDARAGA